MEVSIEAERDALLALLDRMLRAEAREQAPAQADRGDWLYGKRVAWLERLQAGGKARPCIMPTRGHILIDAGWIDAGRE